MDDSIGGGRRGARAAEVTIDTIRDSEMEVTIREGDDQQNEEGVGEHEDDEEEGEEDGDTVLAFVARKQSVGLR